MLWQNIHKEMIICFLPHYKLHQGIRSVSETFTPTNYEANSSEVQRKIVLTNFRLESFQAPSSDLVRKYGLRIKPMTPDVVTLWLSLSLSCCSQRLRQQQYEVLICDIIHCIKSFQCLKFILS